MVQLNHENRELTIKIVYYGPGLSGKTTNLKALHERFNEQMRGQLLSVNTADDRTLFFDLMPLFFTTRSGLKMKLKLFTVPGQAIHNATRRLVLQGADGVVFVADSQKGASPQNNRYWHNMVENLRENGFGPEEVPIVIQFNKLDLPSTKTPEELEQVRRKRSEPVFGAVAIRGEGVTETLFGLLQRTYRNLDSRLGLNKKFQITEQEFLTQIFSHADLRNTALIDLFPPRPHG